MSAPTGGIGLLGSAIGYARLVMRAVTPQLLSRPTPCAGWDLGTLLRHLNESLEILRDGVEFGFVRATQWADRDADPVIVFEERANDLLAAWSVAGVERRLVTVDGWPLPARLVADTGAVEIAVHGWDIARACGRHQPIPTELAIGLLAACPLVVADDTRDPVFAAPVAVPSYASPGDRLVALLGRQPR